MSEETDNSLPLKPAVKLRPSPSSRPSSIAYFDRARLTGQGPYEWDQQVRWTSGLDQLPVLTADVTGIPSSHLHRSYHDLVLLGSQPVGVGKLGISHEVGNAHVEVTGKYVGKLELWTRQLNTQRRFFPPHIVTGPSPQALYETFPHTDLGQALKPYRREVDEDLRVLARPNRAGVDPNTGSLVIAAQPFHLRPAVPSATDSCDFSLSYVRADSLKLTDVTAAIDVIHDEIEQELMKRLKSTKRRERYRALAKISKVDQRQLCSAVVLSGLPEDLIMKFRYGAGSRSAAKTYSNGDFPSSFIGPRQARSAPQAKGKRNRPKLRAMSLSMYLKLPELAAEPDSTGTVEYLRLLQLLGIPANQQIPRFDCGWDRPLFRALGINRLNDALCLQPSTVVRTVLANLTVGRMTKPRLQKLLCHFVGRLGEQDIREYVALINIAWTPVIIFAQEAGAKVSTADLVDPDEIIRLSKRPRGYGLDEMNRAVQQALERIADKIAVPEIAAHLTEARARKRIRARRTGGQVQIRRIDQDRLSTGQASRLTLLAGQITGDNNATRPQHQAPDMAVIEMDADVGSSAGPGPAGLEKGWLCARAGT